LISADTRSTTFHHRHHHPITVFLVPFPASDFYLSSNEFQFHRAPHSNAEESSHTRLATYEKKNTTERGIHFSVCYRKNCLQKNKITGGEMTPAKVTSRAASASCSRYHLTNDSIATASPQEIILIYFLCFFNLFSSSWLGSAAIARSAVFISHSSPPLFRLFFSFPSPRAERINVAHRRPLSPRLISLLTVISDELFAAAVVHWVKEHGVCVCISRNDNDYDDRVGKFQIATVIMIMMMILM
jgi:hypothetical protein